MSNNKSQFDLLIVDDQQNWIDVISAAAGNIYSYNISNSYEDATQMLKDKRYKIVCLNLQIKKEGCSSSSSANGRDLLRFLRKDYSDLPVILISGYIINPKKYISEYYNIKELLIKCDIDRVDAFIDDLKTSIDTVYLNLNKNDQEGGLMIIELLTTTTVGAGMKFLFDRLGKSVDRLNDEQLAKIKKAESAKNDQELEIAKESMKELRNIAPGIDSIDSFVPWVEDQVRADYDDLLKVSKLVLAVLVEKTKSQEDKIKKDKLLKMEAALASEIKGFENTVDIDGVNSQITRSLHERMKRSLDFIKK